MTPAEPHHHPHHHDDVDWDAMAADLEREGEVFMAFVTDAAARIAACRPAAAPPVRRVLDVGSGPGVGTCELATRFPDADVIAVDSSAGMLAATARRAEAQGLSARVATRRAELPAGLDGLDGADVIWASMVLHHVGDEVAALRALGGLLADDGVLAVAEFGEPMRLLPDDIALGRPGLLDRLDAAGTDWVAAMREGLPDATPSEDVPSMLAAAGLEVIESYLARVRIDAPAPAHARRAMYIHLQRMAQQVGERLDADDRATLAVLTDPDDDRGVMQRPDVFVDASHQIFLARRR